MPRLIIISDTHVHPWRFGTSGDDLTNERMLRTIDVIRRSLQQAHDEDAVWVHAGDIIHTTGHVRHPVASAVVEMFADFPDVPKVVVPGNHDGRGRGGRVELAETFQAVLAKAVPNVTVLQPGTWVDLDGEVSIVGDGAQPSPGMIQLDGLHPDPDRPLVGVFHAEVVGASYGHGVVASRGLDADALLRRFVLSIVGDIHHPHVHRDGNRVVLVPGAPEHHNFGDSGVRGWWVAEVGAGGVTHLDSVPAGSPMFVTVDTLADVQDDGNFYRVREPTDPAALPDNATAVVAAPPTAVEERDLLQGARDRRDVLRRWMELRPPARWVARHLAAGEALLAGREQLTPVPATLRRTAIRDFGSYEAAEIEHRPGVHLVLGRSCDFGSNGAGKSTFVEAPFWGLFGRSTKGVAADEVIRDWRGGGEDAPSCEVTNVVELGSGRTLEVVRGRSRSSGPSLTVRVDGEEAGGATLKDLQARIEGAIGYSPDLYRAVGYFSQQDVVLLSRKSDAEVKALLGDFTDSRAYDEAATAARAAAKEAEADAQEAAGRRSTWEQRVDEAADAHARARTRVGEWDASHATRVDDAEAAAMVARVAEERAATRRLVAEERLDLAMDRGENLFIRQAEEAADVLAERYARERTETIRAEQARVRGVLEETADVADVDAGALRAAVEDAQARVADLRKAETAAATARESARSEQRMAESRRARAEQDLARVMASVEQAESGKCPTCGGELKDEGLLAKLLDEARTHQGAAEAAASERDAAERRASESIEAAEAAAAEREGLETAIRETQATLDRVATREAALREAAALEDKAQLAADGARERAVREAGERRAARIEHRAARIRRVIGELERRREAAARDLREAEAAMERVRGEENPHREAVDEAAAKEQNARAERWRAHMAHARARRKQAVHEYWGEGMAKGGIQSLLIDDLAVAFNRARARVFPTLTRGVYDVQMSTTSTTRSGESRDRVEFRVFYRGREVTYASLSGGQRMRVDLGVLLTMTLAASATHGVQGTLGMLVLDEVADHLDDDGAEALAETVADIAARDVPCVYVISQKAELQALFDSTIHAVQREDGVSELFGPDGAAWDGLAGGSDSAPSSSPSPSPATPPAST